MDGTEYVPNGEHHGDKKFRSAANAMAHGNVAQAASRWEAAAAKYKAELNAIKRQEVDHAVDQAMKAKAVKKQAGASAQLVETKKKAKLKKMPSSLMAEAAKLAAQRKSEERMVKKAKKVKLKEEMKNSKWLFQSNKDKEQENIELENERDIAKAKAKEEAKKHLPPG